MNEALSICVTPSVVGTGTTRKEVHGLDGRADEDDRHR
jgi:hypothetical protein